MTDFTKMLDDAAQSLPDNFPPTDRSSVYLPLGTEITDWFDITNMPGNNDAAVPELTVKVVADVAVVRYANTLHFFGVVAPPQLVVDAGGEKTGKLMMSLVCGFEMRLRAFFPMDVLKP